jgi:hypothetical protein
MKSFIVYQLPEFPVETGSAFKSLKQAVPVPIPLQFPGRATRGSLQVSSLNLHSSLEERFLTVDHDEVFGTAKIDVVREWFCDPVGSGKKTDPFPEDSPSISIRDEVLLENRLERVFQDPGDSLVWFEATDTNAPSEIEKLRLKAVGAVKHPP